MNSFADENHRAIQKDVGIIGDSPAIQQLIETIEQIASTDISVLISGESGTGKELVAKAIHRLSSRHSEPLITVNCGAIPEGILESELFGHEKGSFTGATGPRKGYFELADKGSIFLDEIGELPLSIQVKLLRVLEVREFMRVGGTSVHRVDVRFITATNKALETEVKKGNFRQDLFYRLNAIHVRVPALRERKGDIPLLAKKFASDFSRDNLIEFGGFDEEALYMMQDHTWPGNVRELRNFVEKVIVLEKGERIGKQTVLKYLQSHDLFDPTLPVPFNKPKEDVEREFLLRALLDIKSEIAQLRELILTMGSPNRRLAPWRGEIQSPAGREMEIGEIDSAESVADMEREMIKKALTRTNGNKRKAAKILGLSERTLYRKINKYGLIRR